MPMMCKRANLWFFLLLGSLLSGCTDSGVSHSLSPVPARDKLLEKPCRILILGDSLTEGYGVSPNQAYPYLLQEKLNANRAPGKPPFEVINGGVTGSTTSGGASRVEWHLKSPPDFFIVALGGNDGLRGIPPAKSKQNLKSIIEQVQKKNVPVMIAGMKLPPNYGPIHLQKFAKIFPELSNELGVPLLPFLLEGVGGNPKMNLPDRIHPNPAGHKIICETVHQHLIKHLPKNLK